MIASTLIILILAFVVVAHFFLTNDQCDVKLEPSDLFTFHNLENNYEPYGYVAHALGSIDGQPYTNSKEAFELSYQSGFRVFEVDLVLLKDGTVFGAHDNHEKHYSLNKSFLEATQDELLDKQYLGKYTPLTGNQLLDLLEKYPDIYLIADPKYEPVKIIETLVSQAKKKYPSVLERLIPHLGGPKELCQFHQIYPFKDYMLALYRAYDWKLFGGSPSNESVVKFVKNHQINAVMMWWEQRYTPEFQEALRKAGAVTYVHSLNDPEKIVSFKEKKVGAYSDGYIPNTF